MVNETQVVDDGHFYDNLIRDIIKDWRKFEDVLLNDEYLPHHLLEVNLDGFTQFLKENPSKANKSLIESIIINHRYYTDAYDYYYILRILDLIVKENPYYFTLFDDEYKDQQFVKTAYAANPDVKEYFSSIHCLYISDNPLSKLCCNAIMYYKLFKIFIGG